MLCNKCGNTASICLCQLKDHGATATESNRIKEVIMDEFPDVIYLQGDDIWEGVAWCQDKLSELDVKYVRADTIEAMNQHTRESIFELGHTDGRKVERDKIVKMLKEWKRHQDIMGDPKSLYYSKCIEEILGRIEVKNTAGAETGI